MTEKKPEPFDPKAVATYFITDPHIREINDTAITDKMRKDGIVLTEAVARHYVAAGTLSTKNPAEDQGAKDAVTANTASADIVDRLSPSPPPVDGDPAPADREAAKRRQKAAAEAAKKD